MPPFTFVDSLVLSLVRRWLVFWNICTSSQIFSRW